MFDPRDVYIAMCLQPCSSRREGLQHEARCAECQRLIRQLHGRGDDDDYGDDTDEHSARRDS